MPLSRYWSTPTDSYTVSDTINNTGNAVTVTVGGASGYNLGADSIQVPTIITAPPNAASVASAPLLKGVPATFQNTLGYDATFIAYVHCTAASVATIEVGVGSTATPPLTAVNSVAATNSNDNIWTFSAPVPNGYYFQIIGQAGASGNGGTFTASVAGTWFPF